jgi:mannosyltransferase OCH1-like enzyme
MAIPKIFHQTYKTKDISELYKAYQQKLLELHPDWEYRFYDDSDCKKIVTQYFPSFIPIYDGGGGMSKIILITRHGREDI